MIEHLHVATDESGNDVFVVEAFAQVYGPRAATWLGPNNERLIRDGDVLRGVVSCRAYRLGTRATGCADVQAKR